MLPDFATQRLLLRPRTMADFAACLAMDRDPAVTRYIAGPWNDPAAHAAFIRERMTTAFGDGLGYWSIFPKDRPELFIGWILLIPDDGIGPEVEIGWRLNRAAWGHGFAPEAARPVVEHAFETLGLERIVADIDPRNLASLRVAEKLGMRHVGDGRHGAAPCKCYVMARADFRAVATTKL